MATMVYWKDNHPPLEGTNWKHILYKIKIDSSYNYAQLGHGMYVDVSMLMLVLPFPRWSSWMVVNYLTCHVSYFSTKNQPV